MKKRLTTIILLTFATSALVACGDSSKVTESTADASVETEISREHEHNYTEEITVEATCETDGEATYTCECGDTYTEPIKYTAICIQSYLNDEIDTAARGIALY